ncbi:hypothetical protein ACNUDM_17055 [Vibrio chaetopteri]|uniref:hypothetical protein n=1 Tax=Vibrio chaetopteri TaxID=3016528 RepID=UPI003AB479DD
MKWRIVIFVIVFNCGLMLFLENQVKVERLKTMSGLAASLYEVTPISSKAMSEPLLARNRAFAESQGGIQRVRLVTQNCENTAPEIILCHGSFQTDFKNGESSLLWSVSVSFDTPDVGKITDIGNDVAMINTLSSPPFFFEPQI